jgi:hypothetical protein
MSELKTDLASVLADLVAEFADDETGELADVEFARVRRKIQANLDINDGPGSRDPVDIADFIYWHSEPASISAATRWVESLTATEVARLGLGEVLGALHPGM